MKFMYSSGQRPLDGYTLKRGVGQGGFGEVYYGVSDGGKEVALKLVRGNLDIELRGVAQCLNLKHPNLVSLIDLKTDAQGDRWVIMEYISGESLNAVLGRHPQGLAPELAQQWFMALTKAVGYLHDHGIVHRDLKPGNIFLESGVLKVGDYGLSKFMSCSQRTAQTQSVGTVHYMAPEISTGNYNKQIDVYAAGVILYEMLTGHVPFEGESAGEILMKHLTSPPDLSKLPAEFVPVVAKALAKNPAQRYQTMAEMGKAVEAVGSGIRPAAVASSSSSPPPKAKFVPEAILTAMPAVSMRGQVAELSGSMALATVFAALGTLLWGATTRTQDLGLLGLVYFLTVGVSWAVLMPAKAWSGKRGDAWSRRLLMMTVGMLVGILSIGIDPRLPEDSLGAAEQVAFLPSGYTFPAVSTALCYFGLAFFAMRWWKIADRRRSHRFSLAPILAAGFWAFVPMPVLGPATLWPCAVSLVLGSAIVQLVSPWEPPPPVLSRRVRLRYA